MILMIQESEGIIINLLSIDPDGLEVRLKIIKKAKNEIDIDQGPEKKYFFRLKNN